MVLEPALFAPAPFSFPNKHLIFLTLSLLVLGFHTRVRMVFCFSSICMRVVYIIYNRACIGKPKPAVSSESTQSVRLPIESGVSVCLCARAHGRANGTCKQQA